MLETTIKNLTAAVEANTTALLGGAAPALAVDPKPTVAPIAETKPKPAAVSTAIDIPLPGTVEASPTTEADPVEVAVLPASIKTITERIVVLCKTKGRESAAKLLADFGVQSVPELKKCADKYPEVLATINALIDAK